MTLTLMSQEELAREMGLAVEDGVVSVRGVARLVRMPLARWGLSPRRAVVRFVRNQLTAVGLADLMSAEDVGRVVDRLVALGECEDVFVGHDRYLAPGLPRWVPTGDREGVLLSVGAPPDGVRVRAASNQEDLVQRICVEDDEDYAALHLGGVRQCSLREWLHPLGYVRHASRRLGRAVRSDSLALADFWDRLLRSLREAATPLGDDADLRLLTGSPGSFFGHHAAATCEGRWSESAESGVWCGFRRGYGDTHWHPVLVSIDGRSRRALDLFDDDEWRWAVLAKSVSEGTEERVERAAEIVKLTFRAPRQLLTAMDLLGPRREGRWTWALPDGAPDLWSHVLAATEL